MKSPTMNGTYWRASGKLAAGAPRIGLPTGSGGGKRPSGFDSGGGAGMVKTFSGTPPARNGSAGKSAPAAAWAAVGATPFSGRLPAGQSGSPPSAAPAFNAGSTRGTHMG